MRCPTCADRSVSSDATRHAAEQRTYAEGVISDHDALDAKCVGLQSGIGELQFEPDGPVHELPGFEYLAWQLVDPAAGEPTMTGFDAAVIKDGVITDLWTVLIPPP